MISRYAITWSIKTLAPNAIVFIVASIGITNRFTFVFGNWFLVFLAFCFGASENWC